MNEFMKVAKRLADENMTTNAGGPFGACIVKDGEIIGKGSNEVIKTCDPTGHAEIMAIRDACKNIGSHDLSGCELYTSCFPCPMCLSAIIWANIKEVYYGNTKEDAAEIGFRDDFIYDYVGKLALNKNDDEVLRLVRTDEDEMIKTFQKYAIKEDKILY